MKYTQEAGGNKHNTLSTNIILNNRDLGTLVHPSPYPINSIVCTYIIIYYLLDIPADNLE